MLQYDVLSAKFQYIMMYPHLNISKKIINETKKKKM